MIIIYILLTAVIVLLITLIYLTLNKGKSIVGNDLETRLKVAENNENILRAEIDKLVNETKKLREEKIADAKIISELQTKLQTNELLSENMVNNFKVISSEISKESATVFLKLAEENFKLYGQTNKSELDKKHQAFEELVKPIKESLKEFDLKVNDLEKNRQSAYELLVKQVEDMKKSETDLKGETRKLISALRAPKVRGQWGEMQLKNAVEKAGLSEYIDFACEVSVTNSEGNTQRPDMIVNLPNGRKVIIDAKTPIDAYLTMIDTESETEKEQALLEHTKQVKERVQNLGSKKYHDSFIDSYDFVVLFLPIESLFSDALSVDSGLIEFAAQRQVIIATPTTLIAMLLTIAKGWQEEKLKEEAEAIRDSGVEFYNRLQTFTKYLQKLGKSLRSAEEHYSSAISSFNSRLLPYASRFQTLKMTGESLPELEEIDIDLRHHELIEDTQIEDNKE